MYENGRNNRQVTVMMSDENDFDMKPHRALKLNLPNMKNFSHHHPIPRTRGLSKVYLQLVSHSDVVS